jgi:hypothetical protein
VCVCCVYAKNPQALLIPAENTPAELTGKLSRDFGVFCLISPKNARLGGCAVSCM